MKETRTSKGKGQGQQDSKGGGAHLAFIDSIEEGVAVLMEEEGAGAIRSHRFPAALLPAGAREGSWIEVKLRVVPAPAGADPAALRRKLAAGDDGGDLAL